MSSKDELGTAATAAADRMKKITNAIAAGGATTEVLQGYAQELRDETNRMLALLDQPAVPEAMREVLVFKYGVVDATWFYAVQVNDKLNSSEARDAAVALVKTGGQDSYERRVGGSPIGPFTYGTDIDGLIQP